MHFRKLILRSISLLCVWMLLISVTPSAYAGYSGTLTNTNIGVSVSDNPGESTGGDTNSASTAASWTLSGTMISGTITPGSKYSSSWGWKTYYPFKSASTALTLTNTTQDECLLSFECSNVSSVQITGHDQIEGNLVTATLASGESVTVTLTTSSSPSSSQWGSDVRGDYTISTELTQVAMTSLTADLNISIKSVPGGVVTGTVGSEQKGEGENFSKPMDTEYSFTASDPEENYFFEGWAFNGVKQAYTTQTISGIKFKGDTTVEALYIVDPVYAITSVVGDGNKDDLVSINSRYVHQTKDELSTSGRSGNDSIPYYSVTATTGTANDLDAHFVPSLQWVQSGTTVKVSANGKATGECEPSVARSWAYANMVSDVIQIHAKADCIITFTYSNSCSGGTTTPGVHVYESTSGTEKIATVLSKGTTYSETSGTVTHTLAANRYLYIYTNGYHKTSGLASGGNGSSLNYSYNASISGVTVEANETKFTQTTTFKDNVGNSLASGKLTVGTTSYTVGENGVVSIPAMPQGQTMQLSVATAPTNYRLIGWEVNGKMVYSSTYQYELTADATVNPIFVPSQVTYDTATGGYQYKNISGTMVDLNGQYVARNADFTAFYKSLQEGFNGSGEVILLGNMTINGDFEVPAGEVLVVPCAMMDVIAKEGSEYIPLISKGGSGAYATLTVNGNTTVNGKLLVSGQQTAANGATAGSYGQLKLPSGYTVIVNSGASLYGYGYVNGAGRILAKNGATIHELCEVRDIPHPQIMNDLVTDAKKYSVMPFNAFFMNTIESKVSYESGAKLEGHLSISYDEITQASFTAISSSDAILLVKGGTVTKYFDSAAKQIVFRIDENATAETGSFSTQLNVTFASTPYPAKLVSGQYYLPMSAGYQVLVAGNLTMNHNWKMLPGAKVDVLQSGTLTVGEGANLVFYRLNDYDYRRNVAGESVGLGFSAAGYPVSMSRYSVSRASIGSAKLNVNGNVIVNGGLYVTDQLITENAETDSALAYKNYSYYDNGYNYLTGTGRIDLSGANTAPTFYENLQNPQDKQAVITTVKLVPIKGLTAEATADSPDQYVSLTGVSKGVTNDAGLNVWSADPCVAGHTTEKTETVAATCTTYGTNAYWTCTVCGDHFSDEACTVVITDLEAWLKTDISENGGLIPATGHDYTDVETVYTWNDSHTSCVASRTCKVCYVEGGEPTETVSTTNISEEVTTPATCAVAGVTTYTATFEAPEGAEEDAWVPAATSKDVEDIPVDTVNGHTYGEGVVTTPATCTTDGEKTYTCSVCTEGTEGHTKTEAITKLGHSETDSNNDHICDRNGCGVAISTCKDNAAHTAAKAATCKEAGNIEYWTCSVCKKMYSNADCTTVVTDVTIAIDKNNHANIVTDEAVAGSCTEDGKTEGSHCEACGAVIVAQETVPATGHKYESTVTAPTCTAGGYTTHTCSVCSDSYTSDETAATSHNAVIDAAVEATCTKTGLTEGSHCGVCGEVIKAQEVVPVKDHTAAAAVQENVVAATCGKAGSYESVVKCSVCSKELSRTKVDVPATGKHTAGDAIKENEKAATCTAEGSYESVVKCTVCGTELSRETVTVEKAAHNYTTAVTAPTCTEAGYTTYTCTACGDTYKGNEVAALGHDMQQTTAAVAPTCEAAGKTAVLTCANGCGKTEGGDEVAALQHDWDDGAVTTDPTCTEAGVKTYTCQNDNSHTKTEPVAALQHDLVDVEGKAATCTEDGYTAYKDCSRCDYTEGKEIIKAGHTLTQVEAKAATCTEKGWEAYEYCTKCDYTTYKEVAATGHLNTEIRDAKEATCTVEGYTGDFYCEDCKTTIQKGDTIKVKPHTAVHHEAVGKTCTTDGSIEHWTCSVCSKYFSDAACTVEITAADIVVAKGHELTFVAAKDATCTESGNVAYYACDDCGKYFEDESAATEMTEAEWFIKALDHNWGEWATTTEPKCEAAGEERRDCTRCDAFETKVLAAIDHKWNAGEVTTDPTCSAEGVKTFTCLNDAAHTKTEPVAIDSNAHDWNDGEVTTDPTCTEAGVKTYTCKHNASHTYTEPVSNLGHSFGTWTTTLKPTCTVNGQERRECTRCDAFETNVLTAPGHKLSETVIAPTCTERGYTLHKCSECDYEYMDSYTDATDHDYELTDSKDATCTEDGYKTYTCKNDASHTYTETVAALNHDWNETTYAWTDKHDVCTATRTCKRDSSHVETATAKIDSVEKTPATCETKGWTTYTASFDVDWATTQTKDVEDIAAKGHSYTGAIKSDGDGKDATHSFKCVNGCDGYGAAVAHTWNDGVATTEPTCTEAGVKTYTCTAEGCGATYTEAIEATGHLHTEDHERVDATYDAVGYTAGTYCVDCETWISGHEEIPMLTGYAVTLDDRFVISKGTATTTLDSSKRYAPGQSFTVTSAKACVVAISYDNGNSYEELSCTLIEGNTYRFTIPEEVDSDFTIGIVLRGDANEDGLTDSLDATRILRYVAGGFTDNHTLDALTEFAADTNEDGVPDSLDATRILRNVAGGFTDNHTMEWTLIED